MKSVGIGGDFLSEMHTARHCRGDLHLPRFANTEPYDSWISQGGKDLVDRIDDELKEILETCRPAPLAKPVQTQISEILNN
jgi:trimethylamine:corrinoid methyltransferase-like protein